MMDTYRVITVRQPWAWAIIHGSKRIENRSRPIKHRGPLLIHAAARFDPAFRTSEALAEFERKHDVKLPPQEELALGAILGVVDLIDCVQLDPDSPQHASDPWAIGPWLWLLDKPKAFTEPIPARGQLGLWTWSGEIG
jgi:hypothetical protein